MAVGVTFESTQKSPLAMAVGLLDLGNRRYGRGSRSRINSRRLVQTNASQTSGGDSSSSSSGNEDDGMSMASEPGAMDWRTFRAKLVASNEATRSISSPSPAQEAVGLEIWQDRMSLENWALLASQNPRLAKEVPWVHSTGGAEAGGVLLAAPFPQGPGLASEGRQVPGAGGLDQRLWQAAVFLVEHGASGGESWGLMLNRPSGYTIQKGVVGTHAQPAIGPSGHRAIGHRGIGPSAVGPSAIGASGHRPSGHRAIGRRAIGHRASGHHDPEGENIGGARGGFGLPGAWSGGGCCSTDPLEGVSPSQPTL
ncbi:hypothetical protein CLOM_g17051 [Closterium sp. NIES-68]|nr:hypothetical protein CLOM_g17051 [Closterium sp. NIES-68]